MTAGRCHPAVVFEIRGYVEPLIHLRLALVQLVLQTASRNAAKRSLARHPLKVSHARAQYSQQIFQITFHKLDMEFLYVLHISSKVL